LQVSDKPVARVNGAVLTDRDLLREMYAIFPYAQQHNGFPKAQEAAIRQGALEMIIFEELVYQEAVRRKLVRFRRQNSRRGGGVSQAVQESRRVPAISAGGDEGLRAATTPADEALAADRASAEGRRGEQVYGVARRGEGVLRQEPGEVYAAGVVQLPEHFGDAAAEADAAQAKGSTEGRRRRIAAGEGDQELSGFRTAGGKSLGRRFPGEHGRPQSDGRDKLPPQIVKAFSTMQPGQVSGLIQIESAYTIVRLNGHTAAKKKSLEEVKADLKVELQKLKYEKLRSGLAKQLRAKAKIEVS
jgi:peptidyl-prolyl cis-trans isomerase SurA